MTNINEIKAEPIAHDQIFALEEVCRICHVERHQLREYVEFEIIAPDDREGRYFAMHQLVRLRRARRLQRDFELDVAGVALALQLLERIDHLENDLARLHRRLGIGN